MITVDAVSGGVSTSGGFSSKTISHTCSGSNRLLVVAVVLGADYISDVTYNGVSMTLQRQRSGDDTVYLYSLVNPPTGAHDIVVTTNNSTKIGVCGISFNGVNTASPIGTTAGTSDSSSPASVNVTTTAPDSLIVDCMHGNAGQPTVGANQTQRVNQQYDGSADRWQGVSTEPASTIGTYNMGWTTGGGWSLVTMEIKALTSTTFYQTVSATAGHSPVLSKVSGFLKAFSASTSVTGTVNRLLNFYRTLSASRPLSPVMSRVRTAYRILSSSAGFSSSLSKIVNVVKILSITTTVSATLDAVRGVGIKILNAATTPIASINRMLGFYRTLSSAPYVLAQLTRVKSFYRPLTASLSSLSAITTAVTIIRYVTLPVSVGTVVTVVLLRSFYRTLTSPASFSATLTQIASHYLTLSRLASFSATQTRDKLIGRTLNVAVMVSKSFTKVRVLTKELSAAFSVAATVTLLKTFYRTLSATTSWITRLLGVGNKYSRQGTSYADKYGPRGTSASDKYTTRNTNYEDKYH